MTSSTDGREPAIGSGAPAMHRAANRSASRSVSRLMDRESQRQTEDSEFEPDWTSEDSEEAGETDSSRQHNRDPQATRLVLELRQGLRNTLERENALMQRISELERNLRSAIETANGTTAGATATVTTTGTNTNTSTSTNQDIGPATSQSITRISSTINSAQQSPLSARSHQSSLPSIVPPPLHLQPLMAS